MTSVVISTADLVWAAFTLSLSFGELVAAILRDRRMQRGGAA